MKLLTFTPVFLLTAAYAAAQDGLREIHGPVPIPNPYLPWIIAGCVVGGLLLLWLLYRAYRRWQEKRNQTPPPTPYEVAIRDLETLQAEAGQLSDLVYAARLSDIVRHYIETAFGIQSERMTTREFLPHAAQHPRLKGHFEDLLEDFLSQCDFVKYAGEPLTPEQRKALFDLAQRFLRESSRPSESEPTPPHA